MRSHDHKRSPGGRRFSGAMQALMNLLVLGRKHRSLLSAFLRFSYCSTRERSSSSICVSGGDGRVPCLQAMLSECTIPTRTACCKGRPGLSIDRRCNRRTRARGTRTFYRHVSTQPYGNSGKPRASLSLTSPLFDLCRHSRDYSRVGAAVGTPVEAADLVDKMVESDGYDLHLSNLKTPVLPETAPELK